MDAENEGDIFKHGLTPKEFEILKDDSDLSTQQRKSRSRKLVDAPTRHPDFAFGGVLGGVQQPQEGRFPGTGGSSQKKELARIDLEIEGAEDRASLIVFGYGTEANHGLYRTRESGISARSPL
jgi:hypothetical protein